MKKRILALVLSVAMVLSFLPFSVFAAETSATISFADTTQRTSYDSSAQVWENGALKLTNNKSGSTTAVGNYSNPARFYKNSDVIIEYPGMTKIVLDCNGIAAKYNGWVASVSDANATAVADGSNVVITFATPVDSFTVTLTASQSRANSITVYGSVEEGEPDPNACQHENFTVVDAVEAETFKAGYSGDKVCDDCGETFERGTVIPMLEYEADSTITIPQANELAAALGGSYSANKYYIEGTVTEVVNTTYGNVYIEDAEGNSFYIYGLYKDSVRYDQMDPQPLVTDIIKVYAQVGSYNGTAQMKNAEVVEHTLVAERETVEEPEDGSTITIPEAIQLGQDLNGKTSTGKFYVVGEITEVYQTSYGNMYIQDGEGNTLTVYGTYNADGTLKYGEMENAPVAGDTVKLYGVIGSYNGTSQMVSGWIVEQTTCAHANTTLTGVIEATCGVAGYTGDKVCDLCGRVAEQGTPTEPLAHDQETVIEGKEPTCTETGLTTGYACSKCGEIQVAQEEIAAKGHTEFGVGGWVYPKEVCGNGCGTVLYDLEAELKTGYAALEYNVVLDGAIVIDYVTTLDLNGKSMALSGSDESGDGIFWVKEGGELTINGEGELNAVGNSSEYKMVLWADGGKITINGGYYTNLFDTTNTQYDLIYVKNGGEITINGGEFVSATPRWTLNSNNDKPGRFIINGGKFYQYDPSNIDTDEGFTSWVDPSCYDVVEEDGFYTLVQHVCDYKAKETVAPEQFVAGYTFYECACGVGYKADYVMPLCNEVQNVAASQITGTMDMTFSWDELDGADMYLVYVFDAEGEQIRGATITDGTTVARINGFKEGVYTVMVRARVGGKYTAKYDGVEVSMGSILPEPPVVRVVNTTKNSITVEWDAIEGAQKYFIEFVGGGQRFAPGILATPGALTETLTYTGFKANTTYEISVCVKLGDTVYTPYGVKTEGKTKDYEDIDITATKTADGIKVEWTVDNADMQWVKRVDSEGNVTQIAVTAETSIIAADVEGANSFYVISRVKDEYGIYRYVTSAVAVAE